MVANPTALCWVKIKTGRGTFSDNQMDALGRIKLPLTIFYVKEVLAPPRKIGMEWDVRSGHEWLDELDDLKDQKEYDDDEYYWPLFLTRLLDNDPKGTQNLCNVRLRRC